MTQGNSATDTVSLPRAIASDEKVMVIPVGQIWCIANVIQPSSGSSVTVQRNCVVTSAQVVYKLGAIYYKENA